MRDVPCFVGIDVAKAQLDIALRPSGERWAVPHEASGVALLVDRGQPLKPTRIVLEATGGLARAVTSALATAGLPVVVVNPRQVRDVARATGQRAKTEALDARALAHFADVLRPTPRPLPDAQTQELRALLGRRQPLIGMRTAAQHRLAGTNECLTKNITAHMTWLNADIATLDDDLEALLRASPLWREQRRAVAECQGHWARECPDVAAGTSRVGNAHTAGERGLGGRGAAPWRQWPHAGQAHDLGRAGACAHRVVHEPTRGDPFQPADQSLLSTPSCSWESQKSGPDRVYA